MLTILVSRMNAPQYVALLNDCQTAASLCFQISPSRSRVISGSVSVSLRCSSKPPLFRARTLHIDECFRSKVAYIKSAISDPFTGEPVSSILLSRIMLKQRQVFTPRAFPGMSESTFLSRSFGDQGVKLRIRKEPRVLG